MENSIKEKVEQDLEIAKKMLDRLSIGNVIEVAKLVGEERRFQETQINAQKQIDQVMENTAKMFGFENKEQFLEQANKPIV